jgi:wyosine [tRNA(Phe)-imidazoG37] synthetase (radical SAM superfamily)
VSPEIQTAISSVYGPVNSWRVGRSLGVDLLCVDSVCSFRCVYCQLGRINVHTAERRVYVPTEKVLADLSRSDLAGADVVTLSGSGEPTLAANLGEVIRGIKLLTRKPVVVLTNSAHLWDAQVRRQLSVADRVFCKLDAADERTFRRVNRPAEGVTLRSTVEGIRRLRAEYAGRLCVQLMLTALNRRQAQEFAALLRYLPPTRCS